MSENNTETAQTSPELTVVDLQNLRSIIDVASRRGAFGAAEMSAVGSVYGRLEAFLNAVAPPQASADATTQPTS
jgi:hypothetical protein